MSKGDMYRPYAIPHVNKHKTDIEILCHHFEWQERQQSMELKYSKALCKLTGSMTHAGKLICFGEC